MGAAALKTTPRGVDIRPRPKKKPRKPLDFGRADGLASRFGIYDARSTSFFTHKFVDDDGFFAGRRSYTPRWQTTDRAARPVEVALALYDSVTKIAPRGLTNARALVMDIDIHEVPQCPLPPVEGTNVLEMFASTRKKKNAHKRVDREWRAGIARPIVDALREIAPVSLVTWTPRGYRVVVLLRDEVPAVLAARLADAVRDAVPEEHRERIEAFPKVDVDGKGWFCALPLVGPNRRVKPDLCTPDGKKKDAIDEFLLEDGVDPEELARDLGIDLEEKVPEPTNDPEAFLRREEAPVAGQLFGEAYAVEMRTLLENGTPSGGSYDAARRFSFLGFVLGYSDEDVLEAARTWFDDPKHEARHCRSSGGRKELLAVVRCNLRHYGKGEHEGRLRRGRMRSRQLRVIFDSLRAGKEAPCGTIESPSRYESSPAAEPKKNVQTTRRRTTRTSRSRSDGSGPPREISPRSSETFAGWPTRAATSWSEHGSPRGTPSGSSPRAGARDRSRSGSASTPRLVAAVRGGSLVRLAPD